MGANERSDLAARDDVAMLVDWENLKYSLAQRGRRPSVTALREAAEQFGRVVFARAYADWEDAEHAGDPSRLYVAGLEPVYVLAKRYQDASGESRIKNSVDVKLAADCIEASHEFPNVGTFIIVSGDNDFLHIVNTLRPRGKKVVVIGVSWTTAAHLTQQADVVLYYDLDIEASTEPGARKPAPAVNGEVKKLEPSVAAAADNVVHDSRNPDPTDNDRRKIAETLDLMLTITKEYREDKRELSVSLLGQELQKRMNPADFQQVGRGKAGVYARALQQAGKVQIVNRDFQDWIFLPGESTELFGALAEPEQRPVRFDYSRFMYEDLSPTDRERVIAAIWDERNRPGSDWLTFKRIIGAVTTVVSRDEPSVKNLVNSMVDLNVLRQESSRSGFDPESRKTYSYVTFELDKDHPDVRRALKLG